jgi:hypothetical protein
MSATILQETVEDVPNDTFMIEPAANASAYFTDIRMHVVYGMAHLVFYREQAATDGSIEFLVVARIVGTSASFKGSLDRFAAQFRRPMSALTLGCPLNQGNFPQFAPLGSGRAWFLFAALKQFVPPSRNPKWARVFPHLLAPHWPRRRKSRGLFSGDGCSGVT